MRHRLGNPEPFISEGVAQYSMTPVKGMEKSDAVAPTDAPPSPLSARYALAATCSWVRMGRALFLSEGSPTSAV